MKVLVIITSYNRKNTIQRLIGSLYDSENTDVVVFDDKSDYDAKQACKIFKHVKVIVNPEHRGKAGFWKTYQDIFNYSKEHEYDYYIFMPDDVKVCEGFVEKAIAAYEQIGDCICLCPLLTNASITRGLSRWGAKQVKEYDSYFHSHFFDCCGVVKRDFFEALGWHMNRIEPQVSKFKSSGVGKQITMRLQELGKKMCHVKRTLVSTTDDESEMNKSERARHPMRADFTDNENCVDVYMASLWRSGYVIIAAGSLLKCPEVKTLTIVCNNYTDEQYARVEKELSDSRVILKRGNNEKGSNEKMRYMCEGEAKYIALTDDDLIYPSSYLFKMIHGCNIHNAAVSLHGGRLKKFPCDKYYGGRKMYKWKRHVENDVQVDMLGCGLTLFKREWFTKEELKKLYDTAPEVSMDDIVMSCRFKKKGIPMWVLAHRDKYIKTKAYDASDMYVFDKYKNNDRVQVNYINAMLDKSMLVK